MASKKPAKPKREKLHNGKPMSHWRREADRLVVSQLIRAAGPRSHLEGPVWTIAREKLIHLAKAIDLELYNEVCDERDACQEGMARILKACLP